MIRTVGPVLAEVRRPGGHFERCHAEGARGIERPSAFAARAGGRGARDVPDGRLVVAVDSDDERFVEPVAGFTNAPSGVSL
jgi:hypothetical protein